MTKVLLLVLATEAFLFCTIAHADYHYNPLTIHTEKKLVQNEKIFQTKSVFCQALGDEKKASSSENARPYKRKDYFAAICGSAILPIIGHTYIGRKNIIRGVIYTLSEASLAVSSVAVGLSNLGGENPNAEKQYKVLYYSFWATHCINIVDAYYSVKRNNKKAKEYERKITIIPDFKSRGIRFAWSF